MTPSCIRRPAAAFAEPAEARGRRLSAALDGGREELLRKPRFWMLAHQLLKLRCIGPGMEPREIARNREPPRLRLGVHMGPR